MERLTKYRDDIEAYDLKELYGGATQEMCQKLGKIEDLEEQIGCPLDVVVKALKNGVYVLDEETGGTKWILRGFVNSTQDYEDGTFGFIDDRYWAMKKLEVTGLCVPIFYAWKDYKKTWWLKETKEE